MRTGSYAIVADDLTLRTDSQNMQVATSWTSPAGRWDPQEQAIRVPVNSPETPVEFALLPCDVQDVSGGDVVTMTWHGAVKKSDHRVALYLIGQSTSQSARKLACLRLTDYAAAMALPQAAVGVVGQYATSTG